MTMKKINFSKTMALLLGGIGLLTAVIPPDSVRQKECSSPPSPILNSSIFEIVKDWARITDPQYCFEKTELQDPTPSRIVWSLD